MRDRYRCTAQCHLSVLYRLEEEPPKHTGMVAIRGDLYIVNETRHLTWCCLKRPSLLSGKTTIENFHVVVPKT